MTRAIARAMAAAGLTGALLVAATWIDFTFCSKHQAWVRQGRGSAPPIISDGYLVARPGDAIFVCTTEHRFEGGYGRHYDLGCYCAPATWSAGDLGRLLNGACSIDQPHPSRGDERGACLHARCDDHIQ